MAQSKEDFDWVVRNEQLMEEGTQALAEASNEALEYMQMVAENAEDREWRRMAVEQHAFEIGVGLGLEEHVARITKSMRKTMHRKFKIPKYAARILTNIYLGRLVKNIREVLDERDSKQSETEKK